LPTAKKKGDRYNNDDAADEKRAQAGAARQGAYDVVDGPCNKVCGKEDAAGKQDKKNENY
jgi:hypothetical protein